MACAVTPAAGKVARAFGVMAHPTGDRIHRVATPMMGGVAVYAAFALATLVLVPFRGAVAGVLAGGFAAVVVGLLDEWLTLPPLAHLAGQITAALIAVGTGVGVLQTISVPTGGFTAPGLKLPLAAGVLVTLFWIVGMMNTVNFLDGLDGLATGVSAIAAILLAVWAEEKSKFLIPSMPHHADLILPLCLAGSLAGFLVFNWHPARIFLGDSGAMFLGLALGTVSIVGPAKLGTALLVLVIPVLDVAWAIVRRRMRGKNFLSGDKQHVYHRMMELGMSHLWTVITLYVLVGILAWLDLQLFKLDKLIAFVVLAAVFSAGAIVLETRASRRTAARRPEVKPGQTA